MGDITKLAELLHEAEARHGLYKTSAPNHNWSDWYAAYISARLDEYTPEEAERDAAIYMDTILNEPQN
jgi:hypothetical protein